MRRALKISAWTLAGTAILVVVLGGALWLTANTAPGRAFIEDLTYRLTGGVVRLVGLGGSLPVDLTLDKLELKDHVGVWLTADQVTLRWSPMKLLERRIVVDRLHAVRVHMERTPVGSGQPSTGSPAIPHIDVGQFTLDRVELGAPLVGTPAALSGGGHLELRSLEDARGDVAARRLDGEGTYTLHLHLDPRSMNAVLAVHEPASGPLENLLSLPGLGALSATITLGGLRSAERLEAVVDAGNAHARLHGNIDLTHASADLEYSLDAAAVAPRADLSWRRLALKGDWHGSLADPHGGGTLSIDQLQLPGDLKLARLTADLSGNTGRLSIHSTIQGLETPGPQPRLFADQPVILDASLLPTGRMRPLEISLAHPVVSAHGRVNTVATTAGEHLATLELKLPEVAPFAAFAGQDVRGNASVTAQFTAGRHESSVSLEAELGLNGGTAGWIDAVGTRSNLKLTASLSDHALKVQNLHVAGQALTLTASGSANRLRASPTFAASLKDLQARAQVEVADLHRLSGDLAGNLKLTAQASGSLAAMNAEASVVSQISVRGSPSGTLNAQIRVHGLPKTPGGTLQAQGVLDGAPLNLDMTIDRNADRDFRLLVRRADWKSVHADADLTADSDLAQSHGQLRLHVGQLSDLDRLVGIDLAGTVDGSFGFVPANGNALAHLEVDGKNLALGPLAGNVHLQGSGPSNRLALQLNATLPKLYGAPAELTGAGTLNLQAREVDVASLSVDYRNQSVRLLAPAQVSFAKGLSVDDLKLGAQSAVFELAGQLAPTLDLKASLQHVDPGLVNAFSPGLIASGTLEARARLQGNAASPAGSVRLDADEIRFADDAATGLPALNLHARATLADDAATIEAALTAGAGSKLTASGTVPLNDSGTLDLKMGGTLDVGLANPLLEARGLHAAGKLAVDASVTGSTSAPLVGGGITLTAGSLRDFAHGVNLTDITADVAGNEGGVEIKSFRAKAVSGNVTMTGTLGLLKHGWPVDLKIEAKNAQPVASTIITANLNADLHVTGTALEHMDVAGIIHVNKATIGIPDSLPPDVAVLDVRRRGQTPAAASSGQVVVGLDIDIQAPQQILVQGRGLDADMAGSIKLSGTSDDPVASGGFDLQRGSFGIAGTQLTLAQGSRVGFDGAGLRKKIDPTLDFTAQTTVNATGTSATVTLRITGFADAPRFDFTSSPQLPQDEIMALLLFGEPASSLTALQVASVAAALASLSGVGGSGSNPLVKLQKTLGLDRLTVGSNTTTSATGAPENSGAAISAGRYVTKRVYIEGKQTTAGTSQVQVNVDLTNHLKLQTRLGNGTAATQGTTPENDPGSSVGLSYQFEY
jgi:translocation and assembly module TamB